jgi:hypothetical protein
MKKIIFAIIFIFVIPNAFAIKNSTLGCEVLLLNATKEEYTKAGSIIFGNTAFGVRPPPNHDGFGFLTPISCYTNCWVTEIIEFPKYGNTFDIDMELPAQDFDKLKIEVNEVIITGDSDNSAQIQINFNVENYEADKRKYTEECYNKLDRVPSLLYIFIDDNNLIGSVTLNSKVIDIKRDWQLYILPNSEIKGNVPLGDVYYFSSLGTRLSPDLNNTTSYALNFKIQNLANNKLTFTLFFPFENVEFVDNVLIYPFQEYAGEHELFLLEPLQNYRYIYAKKDLKNAGATELNVDFGTKEHMGGV